MAASRLCPRFLGFFYRAGLGDLRLFRKLAFRLAYFWRITPNDLMNTTLPMLSVLWQEAMDIDRERQEALPH